MFAPWAPVLSTSLFFTAASGLPGVDIQKTCQAAEKAMIESFGKVTDRSNFEACMKSEQSAREQLVKDWSTYSSADRARCVHPAVYMPSYVEWLTCLEMTRDARQLQKQ